VAAGAAADRADGAEPQGWQLLLKRVVDLVARCWGCRDRSSDRVDRRSIKLDSPGPVFFRQERIGTGGRRFRVWKFRTMRNGAPDAAHRELIRKMFNGQKRKQVTATAR